MTSPDYDSEIARMVESGEVPVRPDLIAVGADAWSSWYDTHVRCKQPGCYLPHLPCIAFCATHRDANRAQAKTFSFSRKPREFEAPNFQKLPPRTEVTKRVISAFEGGQRRKPRSF